MTTPQRDVPREPTGAMVAAGERCDCTAKKIMGISTATVADLWRAMYDAAPAAAPAPVAWMVGDNPDTAAIYNRSHQDDAFDAAKRWNCCITALTTAPDAPAFAAPAAAPAFAAPAAAPAAPAPDAAMGTHWETCATDGGPRHYDCALRLIEQQARELAAANAECVKLRGWVNDAEQAAGKLQRKLDAARAAIAAADAMRDAVLGAVHPKVNSPGAREADWTVGTMIERYDRLRAAMGEK